MEIGNGQFHSTSMENQQHERPAADDHSVERSIALPPLYNGESIYQKKYIEAVERDGSELSTEDVMRVAAFSFIQVSPNMLRAPSGLSLSGLMGNDIKDVELATLLFSVAEKVSVQQYDRASNLLHECYRLSSKFGDPVQRVVYYFSEALQERIQRDTRGSIEKGPNDSCNVAVQHVTNDVIHLIMHCTLPFSQILQFTSMQAVLDSIESARRVHMIDLSISHGLHWPILMQALATRTSCPVDLLKITAVVSSEEVVAATGKRLSSFAASINIPFEFRLVIVSDMKDLKEDMFELTEGEALGVYSSLDISSLIVKYESLENMMRVIHRLMPWVVTVIDVEAKHNSKFLINRFTEALFYFSALFDCLDVTMERTDINRILIEGVIYAQVIRNIIATEDNERVVRHVGISVWREFFARFGLVEAELSSRSLYQSSILLKQFPKGESCTLKKDGKSLLVGWKGTPLNFVSAWRSQKTRKS